jgi:hypothetical protein
MNIVFVHDNGHGWGIVSPAQVAQARLSEQDFSNFSYKTPNGEIWALEEDCDFPKLLHKFDSMGIKYRIVEQYVEDDHRDNPRTWDNRLNEFEHGDPRLTTRQNKGLGYA